MLGGAPHNAECHVLRRLAGCPHAMAGARTRRRPPRPAPPVLPVQHIIHALQVAHTTRQATRLTSLPRVCGAHAGPGRRAGSPHSSQRHGAWRRPPTPRQVAGRPHRHRRPLSLRRSPVCGVGEAWAITPLHVVPCDGPKQQRDVQHATVGWRSLLATTARTCSLSNSRSRCVLEP